MIKAAIERVINDDLSAIWTLLDNDERRLIVDNFEIHHLKKNQIIYSQGDRAEHLWCLLKGKVKMYKDGIGGRQQILRLFVRYSTSVIVRLLPTKFMARALAPSSRQYLEHCP